MYIVLHAKYPLFLLDFNEILIFLTDFKKILKYQLRENPYRGNQVVPCEQKDIMKLIVALCNFANAPKKTKILTSEISNTDCPHPPNKRFKITQKKKNS